MRKLPFSRCTDCRNVNGRLRRIEFPRGLVRIAHRQPRFVDTVCVLVDAFRFLGFEIERVGADEQRGSGPPLHCERGAHVMESSVARLSVRIAHRPLPRAGSSNRVDVSLAMTICVSLLYSTWSARRRVVLVADVDVAIGVENLAHLALLIGFEGGHFPRLATRESSLRLNDRCRLVFFAAGEGGYIALRPRKMRCSENKMRAGVEEERICGEVARLSRSASPENCFTAQKRNSSLTRAPQARNRRSGWPAVAACVSYCARPRDRSHH